MAAVANRRAAYTQRIRIRRSQTADLLLWQPAFRRAVLEQAAQKKAQHFDWQSAGFWRRPTLARPIAVLPSGLQRFTSVFGMGTGGATTLLSPECGTALAVGCCCSDASTKPSLWGLQDSNFERTRFSIGIRKSKIFSDSLTSTYRFSETLSAFAKATA